MKINKAFDRFNMARKKDLEIEPKMGNSLSTAMIGSKISKLQETGAFYAQKIKSESERLRRLENEIKENEKILQEKREQIIHSKFQRVSSKNCYDDPIVMGKQLKQLKINLEKQKLKYNQTLAENKILRSDINKLRQEKNIYKGINQNLLKELEKKRQLKELILEKSQKTFNDIQNTAQLLQIAGQKAQEEKKQFELEFEQVYQVVDLKEKEQKLNRIKNQELEEKKKDLANKFVSDDVYITQDNQSVQQQTQQQEMKIRINEQKEFTNMEDIKQEFEKYQEIFEQLKKETGKETIEEIVQVFVDQEDVNFGLFNQINSLSEELDQLEKQKKSIEQEIEEIQAPYEDEDVKIKKVKEMKQNIQESKEKQFNLKKMQSNLMKEINTLKIGIPNIFEKLKCSDKKYLQMEEGYLNVNDINETNIINFLSIIEKRSIEILSQFYKQQKPPKVKYQFDWEESNEHTISVGEEKREEKYDKDTNNLKEVIEFLEEERKYAKATNDFKSNRLFDRKDFEKFVDQEMDQILHKKSQQKSKK